MKFLHVADLHIGRRLSGFSLQEDQAEILAQILSAAEACDAVLIAGDLYNKPQPAGDAVRMASGFLTSLAALGKPVFLIAGNHDSPEQVAYCREMLGHSGIFASDVFSGRLQKHVLRDEKGDIAVYLLPFIKPIHVRGYFPDREIATYGDAVRAVLESETIDPSIRNILVAHQYVAGAADCESEEKIIGGLDQIPAELFRPFDYTALGHLHSPQTAGAVNVRYCGSPLKYSLSEEKQFKAVIIADLPEKGRLSVHPVPLRPLRDVRSVKGMVSDLTGMPYSMDYVHATVTDEITPLDAVGSLRITFPNLIGMRISNSRTNTEVNTTEIELAEALDPLRHFIDFYRSQNNDVMPDEERIAIIRGIIHAGEDEAHEAD
jgi:DNA repair protein SbcD/Mre11